MTAIMLALSARSGALAARIGPRLQMSIGPVVTGASRRTKQALQAFAIYFDGRIPTP